MSKWVSYYLFFFFFQDSYVFFHVTNRGTWSIWAYTSIASFDQHWQFFSFFSLLLSQIKGLIYLVYMGIACLSPPPVIFLLYYSFMIYIL